MLLVREKQIQMGLAIQSGSRQAANAEIVQRLLKQKESAEEQVAWHSWCFPWSKKGSRSTWNPSCIDLIWMWFHDVSWCFMSYRIICSMVLPGSPCARCSSGGRACVHSACEPGCLNGSLGRSLRCVYCLPVRGSFCWSACDHHVVATAGAIKCHCVGISWCWTAGQAGGTLEREAVLPLIKAAAAGCVATASDLIWQHLTARPWASGSGLWSKRCRKTSSGLIRKLNVRSFYGHKWSAQISKPKTKSGNLLMPHQWGWSVTPSKAFAKQLLARHGRSLRLLGTQRALATWDDFAEVRRNLVSHVGYPSCCFLFGS